MNKFKKIITSSAGLLSLPAISMAAGVQNVSGLMDLVLKIINGLIPIIFVLALVYFLYGVIKFMTSEGDDAKNVAKEKILYGIIGLFVMVSVWGLVGILKGGFFGSPTGGNTPIAPVNLDNIKIPTVN